MLRIEPSVAPRAEKLICVLPKDVFPNSYKHGFNNAPMVIFYPYLRREIDGHNFVAQD